MTSDREPTMQSLAEGQERLASLLAAFMEEQRQFNAEQLQFNEEQRQFNARTDRRLRTIQDDIAEVKGGHARTETIRRADVIASGLNLIYERTLCRRRTGGHGS